MRRAFVFRSTHESLTERAKQDYGIARASPTAIDGAEVERYFLDGKINEISDYCETDVVNTYRVWLRYELFRGTLSDIAFQASETNLSVFIRARSNAKPHLAVLT